MCWAGGDFGNSRRVDAIRLVMHPPFHEAALAVGGKKQISFEEKKLERARFGGCGARARSPLVAPRRTGFASSLALVSDRARSAFGAHARVKIREMEKAAGDGDGERLVAIQRVKPHPGLATIIVDIGPHIQLQEPRNPWERRQPRRTNTLHEKWHHADVGVARESIDIQTPWQRALHGRNISFPMGKKQFAPALSTNQGRGRALSRREALGYRGKVHYGDSAGGLFKLVNGAGQSVFHELAVLGETAVHSPAPEAKAGWLQLATHDPDHILLGSSRACADFLEGGAILPRESNNGGNR